MNPSRLSLSNFLKNLLQATQSEGTAPKFWMQRAAGIILSYIAMALSLSPLPHPVPAPGG